MAQNPIVTIEMENGDLMKAELYPEIAPNTVNNFISLVKLFTVLGAVFGYSSAKILSPFIISIVTTGFFILKISFTFSYSSKNILSKG